MIVAPAAVTLSALNGVPMVAPGDDLSAMLLSVYPKLGFRDMTDEHPDLPGTSIASVFHDQGYRTGFITPSELTWAGWDHFLSDRGFDDIRDERDLGCPEPISSWGVEDRCMVDDMLQWIDRDAEQPFFLMAPPWALLPLVVIGGLHMPHGGKRVGEVVAFALVTAVVSNVCFFRALRHIAPGVVAMIMTMEVALAIFWSWLFLGESVEAIKMVGAAVVIAGVLIAQWVNLRGGRTAPVTLPAP